MSNAKPDHVRGVCDIADCEEIASRAFRDAEGDIYVEVCAEHASSLEGFDSDYERVAHDSPHRSPDRTEEHSCGGELRFYELDKLDDADEYRVCTDCGYALLIEHVDDESMRVKASTSRTV